MNMLSKLTAVSAFALGVAIAGTASAASHCERGDLDERYCDVDGDLIADVPTEASEWMDPDTLIFAYTPVEDPAVYKEVWSDFLTHLEATTGKDVVFFPVQSNAAQIEAHALGSFAHCWFQHRVKPVGCKLRRFPPFHHHGVTGRQFWL